MSDPIRAWDLAKRFGSTLAVNGLDLAVPEGSIFALVGPNGAGKTTTLKVLMNIHRPSGGRAEVLGVDSRRLSPREFAEIGYVSENQELPGWMTVGYFLNYLAPFYPKWDAGLATELTQLFQLPLDRAIGKLSRGMRMKAALASSLAYRPRLIVLDEPFTGLDPLVRDEFIEALLARAEGATILISSHDLAEIESFASHVAYLDEGRLRFAEEAETLGNRFKEILLSFEGPPLLPEPWPAPWLQPETAGTTLRFVDSQFDPERTPAELHRLFPEVRDIAVSGMPLRSIFVTLAKSFRRKP